MRHGSANPQLPDEEGEKGTQSEPASGAIAENESRASGYHKRVLPSEVHGGVETSRSRRGWSLVEEFEHEGHLYRLVRRPLDRTRTLRLTNRERQAVQLASEGKGRAEIARELGVSPSTVGVLLHRAGTKFGAKTRHELIERFRAEGALAQGR